MSFQSDPTQISWRLHLRSSPERVYALLDSDEGRARFWAESAIKSNEHIHFIFPNGFQWRARLRKRIRNSLFQIEYIGGSIASFELHPDGRGGTELALHDVGVDTSEREEVIAGWVSVLMALKAAVDFDVDLRNHDSQRNWDQGYVEN